MKRSSVTKHSIPILLVITSPLLMLSASNALAQNDEASLEDGQWLYERSCAGCHGMDGEGIRAFGTSLKDSAFASGAPEEAIISLIQNGRLNRERISPDYPGMPPFDYIRGLEARALANYVKGALQNEGN